MSKEALGGAKILLTTNGCAYLRCLLRIHGCRDQIAGRIRPLRLDRRQRCAARIPRWRKLRLALPQKTWDAPAHPVCLSYTKRNKSPSRVFSPTSTARCLASAETLLRPHGLFPVTARFDGEGIVQIQHSGVRVYHERHAILHALYAPLTSGCALFRPGR